jgi:hypothetical protein
MTNSTCLMVLETPLYVERFLPVPFGRILLLSDLLMLLQQ